MYNECLHLKIVRFLSVNSTLFLAVYYGHGNQQVVPQQYYVVPQGTTIRVIDVTAIINSEHAVLILPIWGIIEPCISAPKQTSHIFIEKVKPSLGKLLLLIYKYMDTILRMKNGHILWTWDTVTVTRTFRKKANSYSFKP